MVVGGDNELVMSEGRKAAAKRVNKLIAKYKSID